MARSPRQDVPGARHLVMNQGGRGQAIFLDESAYRTFLDLLAALPSRNGVRVHGYALLPGRFHLLVECPQGGLDQAMQFVQARYARWMNSARGWDGPLFRGRYRSRRIEDPAHWAHLLVHLHLAPVRERLVSEAGQAKWTSHAAYVGAASRPPWLVADELLAFFGSVDGYLDALWDVQVGRNPGPEGFDPDRPWRPSPAPGAVATSPPPPPMDEEQAWAALRRVTGLPRAALVASPGPGKRTPARWLAMTWLPRATGQTRAVVATWFGVDPAVLSRSSRRLLDWEQRDPELRRWSAALDEALAARDEA